MEMNTKQEIRNRDEHGRKSEIEMKIDLLVALLCMRSMGMKPDRDEARSMGKSEIDGDESRNRKRSMERKR